MIALPAQQMTGLDMGNIVIKLHDVRAEKERRENRAITWETVSKETGIAYTTLLRMVHDDAIRYDRTVLLRLCEYFACSPGDIIKYEQ